MAPDDEPTKDRPTPGPRATLEWQPVELEHLRVSRFVRQPLGDVEQTLRVRPEQLLQLAYGEEPGSTGGVISIELHHSLPWLRVPVHVQSFTPPPNRPGAVISIQWMATRAHHLFPTMDAELAVLPSGAEASELVLEGSYRPPLGLVGLIVDRVVGRWVAGTTARTFLDRLADYLDLG